MLKKFKNQKGFTLIEMMIVMLIISVLLSGIG
ncbi:prepilin-type N-terminal cleavage/methylation domain-containing protein [Bacillus salipaludis]